MKPITIYIRNISLLLCGGLMLSIYNSEPIINKTPETHLTEKLKARSISNKHKPIPFSLFKDVVVPLFPALKS